MTHSITPCLRRISSWLLGVGLCSTLFGLTACDPDQLDSGADEFRARLDLGSLEPGDCLALDEDLTTATTEEWTLGAGLPKGTIIEDNLLLAHVFEDNIILRISGPATTDDDTLTVASATALYDDPELDDPCDGYCDGICVDGECYMNLPPFAVRLDGVCYD